MTDNKQPEQQQACCTHLRVSYLTSNEGAVGWWSCDECQMRFTPVSSVALTNKRCVELEAENAALAASREQLRDAVSLAIKAIVYDHHSQDRSRDFSIWNKEGKFLCNAKAAAISWLALLAETPAQALDAIRREAAVKVLRGIAGEEPESISNQLCIDRQWLLDYANKIERGEVAL